jgi:hypothetical protein
MMNSNQDNRRSNMILWKGWGILALLIPAALVAGGDTVLQDVMGSQYNSPVVKALLLFLSAAAVWMAGRKLNSTPVKNLIDPETGKVVGIKQAHSMFWIPMQWYAVIWVIAAVVVYIKESGML